MTNNTPLPREGADYCEECSFQLPPSGVCDREGCFSAKNPPMPNEQGPPGRIAAAKIWVRRAKHFDGVVGFTEEPMSPVVLERMSEYIPATRVEELERTRQLVMDDATNLAGQVFELERALEEIAGPCDLPHRCGQRNRYCDSCTATRALTKHRGKGK